MPSPDTLWQGPKSNAIPSCIAASSTSSKGWIESSKPSTRKQANSTPNYGTYNSNMGTHPHGINRLRSSNRSRMKTFYQVANDTLLVVIGMGIYALITKIL